MKKKPMMWIMKITPDEPGKTIYYFKELFLEENSPKVIGYGTLTILVEWLINCKFVKKGIYLHYE